MEEGKDYGATRAGIGGGYGGYLNRCATFLRFLYGKVQSLRRKQVLLLFATFVVLVVVLQTELNSFILGFHSVAPSDDNADVFAQDKMETSDTGIGRSRENQSPESSDTDPLASSNTNSNDTPNSRGVDESGPQGELDVITKNNKDASHGPNVVNGDRNASDSHAGKDAEEDSKETGKRGTTQSNADREKEEMKSKSSGKNTEVAINHAEGVTHNLDTGESVRDVGYLRTKCFSSSGQPQNHTCAPAVVIAGYEKCGTSALYYKLTKHPEIVAHPKWKENCPTEDSLEAMWSWFENTGIPVLDDDTANALLLNGCIGIVSKPSILRELQRLNPNLKVLAAFRNYADWAYSFYGYRCYPGYDKGCEKLKGPTSPGHWKETRNPSNFAKLVTETKEAGKSPYQAFGVIEPNVNLFRQWLEELVDIVGRDAIMIVKQEDLAFSCLETLDSVAKFLEIDPSRFEDEAYSLVSNTNDHPAQISSVEANSTKDWISAVINSGSVIHQDTRVHLNSFWKPECEWLRDNFDVHFSEVC